MAESLGVAVLDLSTDGSGLEQGLGKAEGTTRSKMSRIGGAIGKGAKVAAAGFAAAGGAAIAAAFKTADYGDEIAKTATKLGVSTDALQEQRYWADRNGISAQSMDRAVGRLNQRIGRAIDGNEKYADAFEAVGVAITDSEGKARSTNDVLGDTIKALSEIEDPATQSARASEIFGTKMARDLMPALQDGSLSLEEAAEKAHELGIVMDEDALAASERFGDNWADVKDSVMGFVRQGAAPLMEVLADRVFPFIRDTAVPVLRRFGDWLGPKLQAAAQRVSAFFENVLVPAFAALSAWWTENGPAIVATAQQLWDGLQEILGRFRGLIDKVVGWFQSGEAEASGAFASIRDFAATTFPQIQAIVTSAVEAIQAIIERVVAIITTVWEKWGSGIMAFAAKTWDNISRLIGGVLDVIQGLFEVFAGVFSGDWSRAWEGVKQIFSGVWRAIKAILGQVFDTLHTILAAAMSAIRGLWDRAWEAVRSRLVNAMASIRSAVSDGIAAVLRWFRDLPGRISSALSGLARLLRSLAATALSEMRNRIGRGIEDVLTFFRKLPGNIKSALGNLALKLVSAGRDLIRGLIDGIKAMAGRAADAAKNAVKGAVDGAKSFLRIGSPSRLVADEVGEPIGEGVLMGVEDVDLSGSLNHTLDALSTPDVEAAGGSGGDWMSRQLVQADLRAIRRAIEEQAREPLVTAMNRTAFMQG